MSNKPQALYIHIPFCDHICTYCDFTKLFYFKKYEKPYLDALKQEIKSYQIEKVNTLYFGGGTPTSLSDEGFKEILSFASCYLDKDYEFTVEANVENLTETKLQIMKECGVNRLSIGVQSTNNDLLKEIGRNHTYEDAVKAVALAKKYGFNNINIDLIFGFKNQSLKQLKLDLENFIKLDIDHISIYSLIVEEGSILFNKGTKEQDEDKSAEFYNTILDFLRKNGYERYEISNFVRNKKYSKHNLTYWHDKEYYGCGLGASGYLDGIRYTNTKNLNEYLKLNFVKSKETLDGEAHLICYLLTNLRLEEGFSRTDFKEKFGIDFIEKYNDKINKFSLQKYFNIKPDQISLNDDGLIIMDFILSKLL